jgi:hypothetical protein
MKTILIIASLLLSFTYAISTKTELANVVEIINITDIPPVEWPSSAAGFQTRGLGGIATNAERIKRSVAAMPII